MMHQTISRAIAVIALAGPLLLAGCDDVVSPAPAEQPLLMRNARPLQDVRALAFCPASTTSRASAVIGRGGGTLALHGHRLTIPPGVLTGAKRFTLTEPAGQYLQIDIKVAGTEHYRFDGVVGVTISYSRCPDQHRLDRDATAWYLPTNRRERPEEMGSVIDASRRSIGFLTTHLSTYAVAY